MRAFNIGDRIKVGETSGDVTEKTLLVTKIRTIKNVDVTIPNSVVLNSHVLNYSILAKNGELILNTSVTIGYNVPWRQIYQLLTEAAGKTDYINESPAPFVLQTALNDFYVSYELNAYTSEASKMANIYSQLHAHIQDSFNAAGVEIMSPHYRQIRDGATTTIPEEYRPEGYQPEGIRISSVQEPRF
jgi:small-conductance mechanosensitive channel